LIVGVDLVLKNKPRLEINFIKKLQINQNSVNAVEKNPINGIWIMIIAMIVLEVGFARAVIPA